MQEPPSFNTDIWRKLDRAEFPGKLNQPDQVGWVNYQISRLLYKASGNWGCFVKVWTEAQLGLAELPFPVPFWKVPTISLGNAGKEGNYTSWLNNHGLLQSFLRLVIKWVSISFLLSCAMRPVSGKLKGIISEIRLRPFLVSCWKLWQGSGRAPDFF